MFCHNRTMVEYKRVAAHNADGHFWLRTALMLLLLCTITTALFLVSWSVFFADETKYARFTNPVPDYWHYRTQIYAEAIYSNVKVSHDYRLNKNNALKLNTTHEILQNTATNVLSIEEPQQVKRLVCYYTLPNAKDKYHQLLLSQVDAFLCTHINIGCLEIKNGSLVLTDYFKQTLQEHLPVLRAKNPQLKFLLWVGGGGSSSGFPYMVHNHTTRKTFIRSLKQVLRDYHLDGVDLDWEFPSAYNKERQHFSQLLYEIKQAYRREKRDYLLSVAVAAPEGIALFAYDVRELNIYADHVNLMSYDYHFYSHNTPFTGLNAPLYARTNEHSWLSTLNINYSVHWWINNGLAAQKLVVGLPTYGHSFTLVNPFNKHIGAPAEDYGHTGYKGFTTYAELCWFMEQNLVSMFYDEKSCSPYVSSGTEWISFENELSLQCKVRYIKTNNLGGAMVFSLNTDDFLKICRTKNSELALFNTGFPLTKKVKEVLW